MTRKDVRVFRFGKNARLKEHIYPCRKYVFDFVWQQRSLRFSCAAPAAHFYFPNVRCKKTKE